MEEAESSQLAERGEPTDFWEGLGRANAELAGRMQSLEVRTSPGPKRPQVTEIIRLGRRGTDGSQNSSLEGRGFEPPVPLTNESSLRRNERCGESEKASQRG